MRAEDILRRLAIGCAVFMLFGPLGGRTMRVGPHQVGTDAGIYNVVAVFSGIVVLAFLAFALWARERDWRALPALSALISSAAFALSVFASGVFVWARWRGEVWSYAGWSFTGGPGRNETLHLPWGPPFFTLAAFVGAVTCLGLAITWLRPPLGAAARLAPAL